MPFIPPSAGGIIISV